MLMCGVGSKICGSLDENPSVTMEVIKVKFFINCNTLTVLYVHQKSDPKVQQDFKVKSRSHYDVAHLHPLTNVPSKYQLRTPYGF